MKRSGIGYLLLLFLMASPALAQENKAGRFDNGKMWTFERPPADYFLEAYDLETDDEWFTRARMGALRIPGCSASFASPHGLVLTNHHCARAAVAQVTLEGESLLDEGFHASQIRDERPVDGFFADQLVEILDVTVPIRASLESAQSDAERASMLQDVTVALTDSLELEYPGHRVQLVPLYNGGLFSAYVFRRYEDVRLVLAPELQIGYFGGDADNFTFPRYALDFSFFRIYEDGEPLQNEHYFPWSEVGISEGQAVFAIGNPGSTFRLETVAQLEYRRDVLDGYVLNLINSRVKVLQTFLRDHPAEATQALRNQTFGLLNAQKLYRGRVKALSDAAILERRGGSEFAFSSAISRSEDLNARFGSLIDDMAATQGERRGLGPEFGAFLALNVASGLASGTEKRALAAITYLDAIDLGIDSTDALEALSAIPDLPSSLERGFLEARLRDFATYLGSADALVADGPSGSSPSERAASLLELTVLNSAEQVAAAIHSGNGLSNDPAVKWARGFQDRLSAYQSASAGLSATEAALASRLGQARFEVYGTSFPPDATFSLRISDGVVKGYEYNGTFSPAFTTLFGVYDRHFSHENEAEWALPARWLDSSADLVLSTPANFVSTSDITGGSSGSPMVNRHLELVGLIFDGNIESLSGDFLYLDETSRAVSVDVRGMLQVLKHVYHADQLVTELTTGELAETPMQGGSR